MKRLRNKYITPRLLTIALATALTLTSCKPQRPGGVLPETQMENLLYDYHIAKAMGEDLPPNENYKRTLYLDYVYQKYGTTAEIVDSSLVWYTRNTEQLSKMYERINKRVKDRQQEIDRQIAARKMKPAHWPSQSGNNAWPGNPTYHLTGYPLNNKITFTLPADSNLQKRDSLAWTVRYRFLGPQPDSTRTAATMTMQIQYTNDSIVNATKQIRTSGLESLTLKTDTAKVKEIRGFIYLPRKNNDKTTELLFIDSLTLTRFQHTQDTLKTDTLKTTLKTDSLKTE